MDGAIRGIVNSLNDPYSVYLEPKTFSQLRDQIKGSFGGLGILVGVQDEYLTVMRVYEGTPAAREGIDEGDVITRIDEHDARDIDLDTAVNLMRGKVGTEVKFDHRQAGGNQRVHPGPGGNQRSHSGRTADTGTDIGYVSISHFTERTVEETE